MFTDESIRKYLCELTGDCDHCIAKVRTEQFDDDCCIFVVIEKIRAKVKNDVSQLKEEASPSP